MLENVSVAKRGLILVNPCIETLENSRFLQKRSLKTFGIDLKKSQGVNTMTKERYKADLVDVMFIVALHEAEKKGGRRYDRKRT